MPAAFRGTLAGFVLLGVTPLVLGGQDSTVAPAPARNTNTGVYTPDQAKRGESAYYTYCVNCHAKNEYTGSDFKVAWVSRTAYDIFNSISTQMPDDDPGILSRQQYVDIVAFMFQLNGYPAGAAELPADDDGLRGVRIDALADSTTRPPPHGSWSALEIRRHPLPRPGHSPARR